MLNQKVLVENVFIAIPSHIKINSFILSPTICTDTHMDRLKIIFLRKLFFVSRGLRWIFMNLQNIY